MKKMILTTLALAAMAMAAEKKYFCYGFAYAESFNSSDNKMYYTDIVEVELNYDLGYSDYNSSYAVAGNEHFKAELPKNKTGAAKGNSTCTRDYQMDPKKAKLGAQEQLRSLKSIYNSKTWIKVDGFFVKPR
jgi:hypothetical protein